MSLTELGFRVGFGLRAVDRFRFVGLQGGGVASRSEVEGVRSWSLK